MALTREPHGIGVIVLRIVGYAGLRMVRRGDDVRVLVTGGAGFIGSHLCDALLARGDEVICVDNLSTGYFRNISHLVHQRGFEFVDADVSNGWDFSKPFQALAHLASPASPIKYLQLPLETLTAGSRGTENALRLACQNGARFLLASTSEIYGEPQQHPQSEKYWGNVNPVGPRSVYDEAKRFAEAQTSAWRRYRNLDTGIVRIFNTYGPRMDSEDGRVVPSFITRALEGRPLTVNGDGSQTRAFCYVDDMVRGLLAVLDSTESGPVNLGNPEEISVLDFGRLVLEMTGSSSAIENGAMPIDEPTRRCPDISYAREVLGWQPAVSLPEGLARTVRWFGDLQPARKTHGHRDRP